MNRVYLFITCVLFVGFTLFGSQYVFAQSITPAPTISPTSVPANSDQAKQLQDKINEYEGKIASLEGQANTLSSAIKVMDNQIAVTQLRVDATKQRIEALGNDVSIAKKRIGGLEKNIETSTKAMLARIAATYRTGQESPWMLFLTSSDISNFMTRIKYLKLMQIIDKKNIYAAEQSRVNYEAEKSALESKQKEQEALSKKLEGYTAELNGQKTEKQQLLISTKNSEQEYQNLLAKARAEYSAIQGIVSGNGTETEAGQVISGQKIATIIEGASCNSSGGHVHFMVQSNGSVQNPFSYLGPIESNNCSGSSCGSSDGDPFNPSGSWPWPINGPVTMYQGYGSTWATRNTWVRQIYSSHNGLDIRGSSLDVKAIQPGTLYKGSYTGSGGCRLPYVRINQGNGIDTFYLHVYAI